MVAVVCSVEQTHTLWGGSGDEKRGDLLGKFRQLRRQRSTPGVLMENSYSLDLSIISLSPRPFSPSSLRGLGVICSYSCQFYAFGIIQ